LIQIVTALLAAAVLGLCFNSTRLLGIVCTAALCYLFPFPSLILGAVSAGLYFLFTIKPSRKDKP
jgi:hypothetical protein